MKSKMKSKMKFEFDQLPLLNNQAIPQGVVTLLLNRQIINENFFEGIETMQALEYELMGCIEEYASSKNHEILQRIFHLIQIWGGNSGRHAYIPGPFHWEDIEDRYCQIVNILLSIKDINPESQNQIIEMIQEPCCHIHGLGLSFITKHIHFWLRVNLGLNALPIYDSHLAQIVMHEGQTINGLRIYWQRMIELSQEHNLPLAVLERRIYMGEIIVE